MFIYIYIYICIICVHMCICIHMYIYMCVCIYIYIYIHTCLPWMRGEADHECNSIGEARHVCPGVCIICKCICIHMYIPCACVAEIV